MKSKIFKIINLKPKLYKRKDFQHKSNSIRNENGNIEVDLCYQLTIGKISLNNGWMSRTPQK